MSLKLALPLLDKFGETGLALKMHLQTDEAPGFGYWIETGGATTLWEQYNMDNINGGASRNVSRDRFYILFTSMPLYLTYTHLSPPFLRYTCAVSFH